MRAVLFRDAPSDVIPLAFTDNGFEIDGFPPCPVGYRCPICRHVVAGVGPGWVVSFTTCRFCGLDLDIRFECFTQSRQESFYVPQPYEPPTDPYERLNQLNYLRQVTLNFQFDPETLKAMEETINDMMRVAGIYPLQPGQP